MDPMFLFWFWAISATVQITIAVALYHMAEQRFSNGAPWAWMGLLFGPLALLVYGAYVLFDASMERARETAERGRVQRFMREYRQERADSGKTTGSASGGDRNVEQLLTAGRLDRTGLVALFWLRSGCGWHTRWGIRRARTSTAAI